MTSSQWTHTDSRTFATAMPQAIARALAPQSGGAGWDASAASVADLRAMIVGTQILKVALSGQGFPAPVPAGPGVAVPVAGVGMPMAPRPISGAAVASAPFPEPSTYPDADHQAAATALTRTWRVFAAAVGAVPSSMALVTADGAPASSASINGRPIATGASAPLSGAGFVPLLIVGAVVVGVAEVAAMAYVGYQGLQVCDRYLARSQDGQILAQTQAKAMQVYGDHADAEAAAGHPLPITDNEKSILGILGSAQDKVLQKLPGPTLPGPNINVSTGDLVLLGAVGLAAYFALSH